MTNRDIALAVTLEPWNVGRYRIIQPHAALLHQSHYGGRCRHDLGQRGEIEDCVEGHRLRRRNDRPLSVRLLEEDFVSTPDEDDGSRSLLCGNRLFDQAIDAGKAYRVD